MPGGSKKGGGLEVGSAYKMKGSPMKRNFNISPLKQKPGGSAGEAIEHWEKYKKATEASEKSMKKHSSAISKKFMEMGGGKETTKAVKKTVKKKVAKKVASKVLSKAIPGVGWGLAAYDVAKFGRDWYRTGSAKKAWKKMWE